MATSQNVGVKELNKIPIAENPVPLSLTSGIPVPSPTEGVKRCAGCNQLKSKRDHFAPEQAALTHGRCRECGPLSGLTTRRPSVTTLPGSVAPVVQTQIQNNEVVMSGSGASSSSMGMGGVLPLPSERRSSGIFSGLPLSPILERTFNDPIAPGPGLGVGSGVADGSMATVMLQMSQMLVTMQKSMENSMSQVVHGLSSLKDTLSTREVAPSKRRGLATRRAWVGDRAAAATYERGGYGTGDGGVADGGSSGEESARKVLSAKESLTFKKKMINELRKAKEVLCEQMATVKAAATADYDNAYKRLESCYQKQKHFTKHEQRLVAEVSELLEMRIEHDKKEVLPAMQSALNQVKKCLKSIKLEYGGASTDEDREQQIVEEQKRLAGYANPFDWYLTYPRPAGTASAEIQEMMRKLPTRVLDLLGAVAATKQSTVAKDQRFLYGVWPVSPPMEPKSAEAEEETLGLMPNGKSKRKDGEEKYEQSNASVKKVQLADIYNKGSEKDDVGKSSRPTAEDKKRSLGRVGPRMDANPVLTSILNTSRAGAEDTQWEDESDSDDIVIVNAVKSAKESGERKTETNGDGSAVASGDPSDGDDSDPDSDSDEKGQKSDSETDKEDEISNSDDDDEKEEDYLELQPVDSGEQERAKRYLRRSAKGSLGKNEQKRDERMLEAKSSQAVTKAKRQGINLSKVLQAVNPNEQFIFDETKFPKVNITDSFKDFQDELKNQLIIHGYGKKGKKTKISDIDDAILIHHFASWFKTAPMRTAWLGGNLHESFKERRKVFCKAYGLTRFMINAELRECKWDGKEDLMVFDAKLSAVEKRYCDANKTVLDNAQLVNHLVDRLTAAPGLHDFAELYIQQETAKGREVTRQEILQQVHAKDSSYHIVQARKERRGNTGAAAEGPGGDRQSRHRGKQSVHVLVHQLAKEVAELRHEHGEVNAIQKRDSYGLRAGARAYPSQQSHRPQWLSRIICRKCQQPGHMERECRSPAVKGSGPVEASRTPAKSVQPGSASSAETVNAITTAAESSFEVKKVEHISQLVSAMKNGRQEGLTYMKCLLNGFGVDSCLVDTGCTVSGIISSELFEQLQKHNCALNMEKTNVKLESATKHVLEVRGECELSMADPTGKAIGVMKFYVVSGLPHLVIIGNPVLVKGMQQKFKHGRSYFVCATGGQRAMFPLRVHHAGIHDVAVDAVQSAFMIGLEEEAFKHDAMEEKKDFMEEEIENDESRFAKDTQKAREVVMAMQKPEHVSAKQWLELRDEVLLKFLDIMIWKKRDADMQAELIGEHAIELLPDTKPFNLRQYGGTEQARAVLRDEVKKMELDGVVGPSVSAYSSPAFVQKKPGPPPAKWRFLINFQKLNSYTKKDVYPLPRIDHTIDCLRRANVISTMDLWSGYFQIPIRKSDRQLTAFKYDGGLAEFLFMAQGLCNAPSTFQRIMDRILAEYKYDFCLVYLDDIIIFSETFEQHLTHVRLVLGRLRQYNLSLSPSKCHFAERTVKFLGHIVGNGSVKPDPAKVEAIQHMEAPTNHSQCRSFLGLVNYYRVFIPNFAEIARPLHKLASTPSQFIMTPEGLAAFEQLKLQLQQAPVLRCSDPTKEFYLYTDASDHAIGAVLAQKDDQGNDYPIAYLSRTLHDPEVRYSVTERECLAVVWSVRKFHDYIGDREFTVFTDHSALKWLFTTEKLPNARLLRWVLSLQAYTFKVIHRAGKKHQNADALSRLPRKADQVSAITVGGGSETTSNAFRHTQREDIELENVYKILSNDEKEMDVLSAGDIERARKFVMKHNLKMIDEIVYREDTMNGVEAHRAPRLVPYLPRVMRSDILAASHNGDVNGHAGERMMYQNMREYYYWPRMMDDIRKFVAGCAPCQRAKTKFKVASVVPTLSLPIPTRPFGMIGMDALALPETKLGNNTLIVFTDYLTKWVEASAIRCRKSGAPTSQQVARLLLEDVVCRHGIPDAMLSDQGSGFCQDVMMEVAEWLGIKQKTTSPYHPQCNGLTERFNRTFIGMLRTYPGRINDKDWDMRLPLLLFAYRCHYNRNSQRSPFFMLHGYYPTIPGSVMTGVASVAVRSSNEWLKEVMQYLPLTWKHATKMLEKSAERIKSVNAKLLEEGKLRVYEVGDYVYVLDHRSDSQRIQFKEKSQWRGPVKVSKVITLSTYEIEERNRRGEVRTAIVWSGHLKPARDIAKQKDDVRDVMNGDGQQIELNDSDDEKKDNIDEAPD